MSIIYIIPGIGESTRAKNYRIIIRNARTLGFKVIPVNIHWSTKMDMTDYVEQADRKIPNDISDSYILGFSFGAYINAVLSEKKDAKGYLFCSTSPYFKDDLKDVPKETREYFGEKLFNSFKKYSFPKTINKRAWFFIGLDDWDFAVESTKKYYSDWLGKKSLHLVKSAGHELGNPDYVEMVEKALKKL